MSFYVSKEQVEIEALKQRIHDLEQRIAKLEPAPAKRWRDVTAECVMDARYIRHQTGPGRSVTVLGPCCELYDGYRLRKVNQLGYHSFIIEKEEA